MDLNEIMGAISGPVDAPVQPEGGSDVSPLTGHHLARYNAEPSPENVSPQQGAGGANASLAPLPNTPPDGNAMKGGFRRLEVRRPFDVPASQVGRLTGSARNRPEGGLDGQAAADADDAGVRQARYDTDQGRGLPAELGETPARFKGV